MTLDVLFCGVGGQGVVLASRVTAKAALARGEFVRTAETIGMAQRGGSVASHVRVGETRAPLIPEGRADALIAFEPGEALRLLPYLRAGGALVCARRGVPAVAGRYLSKAPYEPERILEYLSAKVSRFVPVDGDAITRACGFPRALNMALLGAAVAAGALPFARDELLTALGGLLPARAIPLNEQALAMGAAAVERKA